MRHVKTILILPALILALIAPTFAGAIRTQVSWIESLPGLGGIQATNETSTQLSYSHTIIGGSPDAAWSSLKANLAQRGWTVTNKGDVTTGATSVQSLMAYKNDLSMKATLTNAGTVGTLAIVVTRGGTTTNTTVVTSTDTGKTVSGTILVNANHVTQTYRCNGNDAVLNGNHLNLTFNGRVSDIVVNGNHCSITVNATTSDVVINGNHNTVRWSASKNPGLDIVDNGNYNNVVRIP